MRFLLLTVRAFAGSATIVWDANPEADLAGYQLYVGNDAPIWIAAPQTTKTIAVPPGKYAAFLTAVNLNGQESGPSNVVEFRCLRLTYQEADDMNVWYDLDQREIIATRPKRFYRLKISNGIP